MSLQQKAIVLDIDGVLAEFTLPFKAFINRFYPYRIAPTAAQKDWEYGGLSRSQIGDVWAAVARGEWDWSKLPSLLSDGDRLGFEELRNTGQVVFEYVTSRSGPRAYQETLAWLARENMPQGRITLTGEKAAFVLTDIPNAFAIIDDSPAQLAAYVAAGLGDKTFIRDWPYNRQDYGDDIRRVSSVAEFCYAALSAITNRDIETGRRLSPVIDPVGTPKTEEEEEVDGVPR